jgi:MFS-type transporter involved in bile tolerance (Atg22 family)
LCSILGPFLVGLTIQLTDSIRFGIIVIPIFLFLSLIPFLKLYFKFNV